MSTWFDKSVIRGCRFSNNYGPGLWFDYSCNANIVENNIASDNEGPGFMIEISRGNILRNNISCNNHKTMLGIDCVPVDKGQTDTYRQESGGGEGPLGILISSSPYTKVYNNLCYQNDGVGIVVRGGLRRQCGTLDYSDLREQSRRDVWVSSHDVDVRNNALINNGRCQPNLPHNGQDATRSATSPITKFTTAMPIFRWCDGTPIKRCSHRWRSGKRLPVTTCTRSSGCRYSSFRPVWISDSRRTRWASIRANRCPRCPPIDSASSVPPAGPPTSGLTKSPACGDSRKSPKHPRNSPTSRWT